MGKTNRGPNQKKKKDLLKNNLPKLQSLPCINLNRQRKKRWRKRHNSIQKLYEHLQQNCAIPGENGNPTPNSYSNTNPEIPFSNKGDLHQDCTDTPEEIINLTPNSSYFYIDTTPDMVFTTLNTPKYNKPHIQNLLSEKKPQKRIIEAERENEAIEIIDLAKKPRLDSSCIIINDDTEKSNLDFVTPSKTINKIHSSTPLTSKKCLQRPSEADVSRISQDNTLTEVNVDLTKEINQSSFLTIDLTSDTTASKQATVIDLVNNSDNVGGRFGSISNSNLSLSGESDVTVIENVKSNRSEDRMLRNFKNRIAGLPTRQKGKILDFIAKEMFNGCDFDGGSLQVKQRKTCATDTAEDTYIKEQILGQSRSRNSIGSNVYNPLEDFKKKSGLRMIIIDGSNVAMEHGKGRMFSVTGLKICIDYFVKRGHTVKAFVPRFRCKYNKSTSPQLLQELANQGYVLFTPSREIQGRHITSYDDRYIVQTAAESDGIIVSGDNFRDLHQENARWRHVIENRLLPFTWVDNLLMFPRDPLGRNGPTLEAFLRHP